MLSIKQFSAHVNGYSTLNNWILWVAVSVSVPNPINSWQYPFSKSCANPQQKNFCLLNTQEQKKKTKLADQAVSSVSCLAVP